ncbi:MAG: CBS domain-containing protein [Planctomycetota bacterium]|jgi:CBS domain-containing protein
MLKAKEIMTENVISVQKETPIYDALELLLENNITGIPVVRSDMTLIGVLSEKDVLTLFNGGEEGESKTVSDFMTQPAIHFDEDEGLLEVCDCLINNYFRRIPVTSKGKLIGIITRSDIIKYILQQKGISGDTG